MPPGRARARRGRRRPPLHGAGQPRRRGRALRRQPCPGARRAGADDALRPGRSAHAARGSATPTSTRPSCSPRPRCPGTRRRGRGRRGGRRRHGRGRRSRAHARLSRARRRVAAAGLSARGAPRHTRAAPAVGLGVLVAGVVEQRVDEVGDGLTGPAAVCRCEGPEGRHGRAARPFGRQLGEQGVCRVGLPRRRAGSTRAGSGTVAVRLAQSGCEGVAVERDRVGLLACGVERAGQLVGEPGVLRVLGCAAPSRRRCAASSSSSCHSAAICDSNSCSPARRDDLGADVCGVSAVAPCSASQATTWLRSAWHIRATTSPSAASGTSACSPASSVS